MAKRVSVLIVATVAGLVVLLSLLVAVAQGAEATPSRPFEAAASQIITPTVLAVYPSEAPNNLDATLVITGTDFQAVLSSTSVLTGPNVTLDDFALPTVDWITSTTLTATVPWGLDPGVYTLTVENPGGEKGTLPNAFTVTQAIGVWTTDGPYGGEIDDLAVSPVTSQTAFAYARVVGLFRTQDGGDSWHIVFPSDSYHGRVSYGLAPTDTLYHYENEGLWRSSDDGEAWEQIYPERVDAFAADPQDEQRLWIGTEEGVKLSIDGGLHWVTRTTGLSMPGDMHVDHLAVNPINPSILYAGLENGEVYKTINAGGQWDPLTDGLFAPSENHGVKALVLSPFVPDIVLFTRWLATGYRSTDGGAHWEAMDGGGHADLAFSPYVSGTVYSSEPQVSVDNGVTWNPLGPAMETGGYRIGLDPTSGLLVYLGKDGGGTWRSRDGGQSWERATGGIAAIRISALDASPMRPETVYALGGEGTFRSDDAGQSWYQLETVVSPNAVAADPEHPHSAYLGGERGLFHNPGGGTTWIGGPITDTSVRAIAVSAISPSILYIGGWGDEAFQNSQDVGKVFRSTDCITHWTELNVSDPISISTISDIAVHPTNPEIVYLATTCNFCDDKNAEGLPGLGIFRSTDSGETWEQVTSGIGVVPMLALAIDPGNPQTIYASGWLSSEKRATVFVSTNGGDSWTATDLYENFGWEWVLDLVVDPLPPHTVYAGSEAGVFWSDDNGATWNREPGGLGLVSVQSLGMGAGDERTILYVGTVGGVVSSGGVTGYGVAIQASDDFVQGGVYQKTIDHRSSPKAVYLPLVLKNE